MTTAALDIERGTARVTFGHFCFRVSACHIATYFIAGILAFYLLDYRTFLQTGRMADFMRPLDSKWIAAGPALQVIRGVLFGVVLYPFRSAFLDDSRGWLRLWLLVTGLAIFLTAGPSPGSLEGVIYTRLSLAAHLHGLPEVVLQTMAFSWLAVAWNRQPKRWMAVTVTVIAALAVVLSILGLLAPRPQSLGGQ